MAWTANPAAPVRCYATDAEPGTATSLGRTVWLIPLKSDGSATPQATIGNDSLDVVVRLLGTIVQSEPNSTAPDIPSVSSLALQMERATEATCRMSTIFDESAWATWPGASETWRPGVSAPSDQPLRPYLSGMIDAPDSSEPSIIIVLVQVVPFALVWLVPSCRLRWSGLGVR